MLPSVSWYCIGCAVLYSNTCYPCPYIYLRRTPVQSEHYFLLSDRDRQQDQSGDNEQKERGWSSRRMPPKGTPADCIAHFKCAFAWCTPIELPHCWGTINIQALNINQEVCTIYLTETLAHIHQLQMAEQLQYSLKAVLDLRFWDQPWISTESRLQLDPWHKHSKLIFHEAVLRPSNGEFQQIYVRMMQHGP